jgi:hypothetical protein
MQRSRKITVLTILFLAVIFLWPHLGLAQGDIYGVNDLNNVNLGTKDLRTTVAGIVNIILGFLGILATLLILYGGFIWMTSQGSSDKIDKAKKIIINGVIGLIIIFSSYAIARFVLKEGYNVFFNTTGGTTDPYSGGTGLGGGILESHYPARNAQDVPRNTNIYVTFREPLNIDNTFILDAADCNTDYVDAEYTHCVDNDYIKLFPDTGGAPNLISGRDIMVKYDLTQKVFEFNPYGNSALNHLGNDNAAVLYKMVLNGLKTSTGKSAFSLGFYDWNFTVSNELDLVAPRITSVLPPPASTNNPRNSTVQINFSEAINPLYATGIVPGFTNISLTAGVVIDGQYFISNQYRTVEFVTKELCGQNSCGGDVYCLPGGVTINGLVRAAGIEDMAGNNLDGDDANAIGGEPADDYGWSFETNNVIDLNPPQMIYMDSNPMFPEGLSPKDPLKIVFSKTLLFSSVNGDNLEIHEVNPGDVNFWFTATTTNIAQPNDTVLLKHDVLKFLKPYKIKAQSGLKDSLQNCWQPCLCTGVSCSCDNPVCNGGPCTGPSNNP